MQCFAVSTDSNANTCGERTYEIRALCAARLELLYSVLTRNRVLYGGGVSVTETSGVGERANR